MIVESQKLQLNLASGFPTIATRWITNNRPNILLETPRECFSLSWQINEQRVASLAESFSSRSGSVQFSRKQTEEKESLTRGTDLNDLGNINTRDSFRNNFFHQQSWRFLKYFMQGCAAISFISQKGGIHKSLGMPTQWWERLPELPEASWRLTSQ